MGNDMGYCELFFLKRLSKLFLEGPLSEVPLYYGSWCMHQMWATLLEYAVSFVGTPK